MVQVKFGMSVSSMAEMKNIVLLLLHGKMDAIWKSIPSGLPLGVRERDLTGI